MFAGIIIFRTFGLIIFKYFYNFIMKKYFILLGSLTFMICETTYAQWIGGPQISTTPTTAVTIGGGSGYVPNTTTATTTKLTVQDDNPEVLIQDLSEFYVGATVPGFSSAKLTLKSNFTTSLNFKNGNSSTFNITGDFNSSKGYYYVLGSNLGSSIYFNGGNVYFGSFTKTMYDAPFTFNKATNINSNLSISNGTLTAYGDFIAKNGILSEKRINVGASQKQYVYGSDQYNTLVLGANGQDKVFIDNNGMQVFGSVKFDQSLLRADQGGSIELGGTDLLKASGTPYLDFHSHGKSEDFNVRLINEDDNTLTLQGGNLQPGNLRVVGKIAATEVCVTPNAIWCDYVFEKDYPLMPLHELRKYVESNKHLPEVPTTAEVKQTGVNIGEINVIYLKKIEELTLYVLDLQIQVDALKKERK